MKTELRMTITFVVLALFLLGSGLVFADYPDPSKAITIVVVAAPGGSSDSQVRAISIGLAKHLGGVSIVVRNIPGAGGKIAYETVYKAKPDGYTIMNYNMPSPVITELVDKTTRYKASEFVPIYTISTVPNVLVVHADTWKTVDEFVEEARKRVVNIGTMGNRTANYLQGVSFVEGTKIKARIVPFKGGAASTAALAGKHIDAVFTMTLSAIPLVRAGKLRPLMVFTDGSDSTFPDAILSKDSKWKIGNFPLMGTYVGPPNMSPDKVKVLEAAFSKALKEPAFVKWTKKMHLNITPMNAEQVKTMTKNAYQNARKYQTYFPK